MGVLLCPQGMALGLLASSVTRCKRQSLKHLSTSIVSKDAGEALLRWMRELNCLHPMDVFNNGWISSHPMPSLYWAPETLVEGTWEFSASERRHWSHWIPVLGQNVATFSVQHNSLHAVDPGTDVKVKFGSAFKLFCNRGSE